MDERLGWPPRRAAAALTFVALVWLTGALLGAADPTVGAVILGLATWLTAGLVARAWLGQTGREGEA
jgi:hypothetical protein